MASKGVIYSFQAGITILAANYLNASHQLPRPGLNATAFDPMEFNQE
ncbi:hypothetical protein [Hydrogenispora ethanolica]|jgi:hypothetical protein|nr:hypothetical protein [Hydrogenispora ethanolica]